jgi:tetratricopeptide (TPR) repeat protein
MKRLFALVVLALMMAAMPARAQSTDEQYVRIYNLMQQGEALENLGEAAKALAKYREAHTALQGLQRGNPQWKPNVVSFRLNYLAGRIEGLARKVQGTPSAVAVTPGETAPVTSPSPAPPAVTPEMVNRLAALESEVQRLQGDKSLLEQKLKEALATRPAAVDPQELAKVQEQNQALLKENELLKASLERQPARPAEGADSRVVEAARQALAEADRKLAEQTETAARLSRENETMQARMQTLMTSAEAANALRVENELLKKQVAELRPGSPALGPSEDSASQLAAAEARVAALTSDAEILRLEKIALQNRVKQLSGAPVATSIIPPPASDDEADRIKRLEQERDELQRKFDAANRELYGRQGREVAGRVDELSNEVAALRARVQVFEARAVPYTSEELALMQPARPVLATADPAAGKRSLSELPEGSRPLVLEAQRHFANREFDKAEEKYLEILRRDARNVSALANLAAIQLEMNHLDDAEKTLNRAMALAPDDSHSLATLGLLKFRQEKYDEALDVLNRAAKLDPQNPEIHNLIGLSLSQKGLRGPAETALRKAIQLDPGYVAAHNNLAVVYLSQQPPMVALARWHYQKAVAAGHPRNADLEKVLDQKAADEPK